MDHVDAPYVPIKQRKGKTTFQQELDDRMRQRRKQGLTYDLTSEESEGQDYDSQEENSLTEQFRSQLSSQRRDRPSSAKRRGDPAGETLISKDSQRFMKKKPGTTESSTMPSLGKSSPSGEKSPRVSSQSEIDRMFGSSPKTRKSPIEERYGLSRTSPSEDRYGKMRTSPLDERLSKTRTSPVDGSTYDSLSKTTAGTTGSPSLLPKTMAKGEKGSGDRKSPLTKEMSKEDLIFGRKTPTYDDSHKSHERKEWKAPSFRRGSPALDEKPQSPVPSESGKGGRKTPMDLQTISENPKPAPRYRTDKSPTDQRMKSRDSSPRSLSLESPTAERRTKPKVDIFGSRKEKEVDFDVDETERDKRFSSARNRRQSPTSRLGQQPGKTAQEKQTRFTKQPDRRTPTRLSDRRTPPIKDEQAEKDKTKKDVGLFDFLHDETKPQADKEKPKPRLRKDRPVERETSLKKSVSHDSITDELIAEGDHPSMLEKSATDTEKNIPVDQSSICAELDNDPNRQREREKERAVRIASSSKQRSDRREADDIINKVIDAQTDPKQFKERPPSAKSSDKIHKPKPRHSLPGSVASDTSMDAFNSTISIRQAIFDEWRKAKEVETKKKLAEQKKLELEKEKKKKKEEQDKKLESQASYSAWMKQKEETFVREQKQKKREEEKKERKKEHEKREKEKDALVNFKKWKERKDELLVENHKKKVEEKHRKQQEERTLKREKEKDNERAFVRWKERKDKVIEENHKKMKEEEKNKEKANEQEQQKKELRAMDEYNEWMRNKEKQQLKESMMKKKKESEFYEEYRPAWSPASKLIPCGR